MSCKGKGFGRGGTTICGWVACWESRLNLYLLCDDVYYLCGRDATLRRLEKHSSHSFVVEDRLVGKPERMICCHVFPQVQESARTHQ